MSFSKMIALAFLAVALAACTTPYQPYGLMGGYSEKQLEAGVWHVQFLGNGGTTAESVQTMWLYRCASLTLEKGYQGFEIVTPMKWSGLTIRNPVQLAQSSMIPDVIGQTLGNMTAARLPRLEGNIRLLNAPFTAVPGKVFDAEALKAILEPLVKGTLCNGNVCPHDHGYLRPDNRG